MSSFKAFGHDYNDMFGRSVRNSLSGASGGHVEEEEQHDSPDNMAAAASSSSSSSSIYQRARRSDNTASSRKAGRTLPSSSYPQTAASGAGARPRRPGQQLRNSKQITRPPDNAVALSAIPGAPDEDPFGGAVTPRRWVTTQKTSTPRGAQPVCESATPVKLRDRRGSVVADQEAFNMAATFAGSDRMDATAAATAAAPAWFDGPRPVVEDTNRAGSPGGLSLQAMGAITAGLDANTLAAPGTLLPAQVVPAELHRRCVGCGVGPWLPDEAFCGDCGSPLPPLDEVSKQKFLALQQMHGAGAGLFGGDKDKEKSRGGGGGGGGGGGNSDTENVEMSPSRLRILYLLSLYTRDDSMSEDSNRWCRMLPLLVIIYEGIIKGVFDHDYAPQPYKVDGTRMYLNVSQEGLDDVDDLREQGFLMALRLQTDKYQSSMALRTTELGLRYLEEHLDEESKRAVQKLVYVPVAGSELKVDRDAHFLTTEFVSIKWDAEEEGFVVYGGNGSFRRISTITEVEAVSYVSSPYICNHLRNLNWDLTNNSSRVDELKDATIAIKDELNENILLDYVRVVICEWIPMGGNQIVAMNEKLGSSERVQGGFFTANIDENPDATQLKGRSEGLCCVSLLDYEEDQYCNFEAEVFFPTEEGMIQVENIGIHFNESGFTSFGLRMEGIQDRDATNQSLDLLSRLIVDAQEDSTKAIHNLLSPHQRQFLDLTYLNDASNRDKFTVIFAESINPKLSAEEYLDNGENENEIKQVLGDTYSSFDLTDDEVLIIGKGGVFVGGDHSARHEPFLMAHAELQTRHIFMKNLYARCFILADVLKRTRNIIATYEKNPESMNIVRSTLSECTEDVIMLGELQDYLLTSIQAIEVPEPIEGDKASASLSDALDLSDRLEKMTQRAKDFEKTIQGSRNELDAIREMANVISEAIGLRMGEALQANTKNLEDCFRAGARNSTSLEIMNVVFAGSLAFDVVDRVTGQYMSIGDRITWVEDFLRPYIVNIPLVWFVINMSVWAVIGGFLIGLMRYAAYMANSVESWRMRVNLKVNIDHLHRYIATKPVEGEDINQDSRTYLKKYTWQESDSIRWLGLPPKFELLVDERYHYILQIFVVINKRRSKLTGVVARRMIFEEFNAANVPDLKPDSRWVTNPLSRREEASDEALMLLKNSNADESGGAVKK